MFGGERAPLPPGRGPESERLRIHARMEPNSPPRFGTRFADHQGNCTPPPWPDLTAIARAAARAPWYTRSRRAASGERPSTRPPRPGVPLPLPDRRGARISRLRVTARNPGAGTSARTMLERDVGEARLEASCRAVLDIELASPRDVALQDPARHRLKRHIERRGDSRLRAIRADEVGGKHGRIVAQPAPGLNRG